MALLRIYEDYHLLFRSSFLVQKLGITLYGTIEAEPCAAIKQPLVKIILVQIPEFVTATATRHLRSWEMHVHKVSVPSKMELKGT